VVSDCLLSGCCKPFDWQPKKDSGDKIYVSHHGQVITFFCKKVLDRSMSYTLGEIAVNLSPERKTWVKPMLTRVSIIKITAGKTCSFVDGNSQRHC